MKNKLLLLFCIATSAAQAADATYESLANAIDTARAQANIELRKGVYRSKADDSNVTWVIKNNQVAKLNFFFGGGTLQSALLDFGNQPTHITFRSSQGACARFRVRKIVVGPGGFIDPSSEITLSPDATCKVSDSGFQTQIGSVLGIQPIASEFFKGRPFTADRMCQEGTPCFNKAPPPAISGPVRRVVFYRTTDENGKPTSDAFSVRLKPEQSIQLPSGNYIKVYGDSGVSISRLEYDVGSDKGIALLEKLSLLVSEGNLTFGGTSLNLARGGTLSFDNMLIGTNNNDIEMKNGSFRGAIGDGSIIRLEDSGGRNSLITIQNAEATLNGLNISFIGGKGTFSGVSGGFNLVTKASRLTLSDNSLVLLQSGNLRLNLACSAGGPECRPFKWDSDGGVSIKGTIAGAAVHLAPGGYITFPGQNKLLIAGGQMLTDILTVDTDDKVTPITGRLQNLALRLEAQDWKIDQSSSIRAANFELASTTLQLQKGDPFPVGEVSLAATVSDFTAQGLGSVKFITATGELKAIVKRAYMDDPKFEGSVHGKVQATPAQPDSMVKVSFAAREIRYYRGYGTAKLDFQIDEASATFSTPPERRNEGIPGGRFELTAYSVPLHFALTSPFGFSNADVSVENGKWAAKNIDDVFIGIRLTVPSMVAASAQHQLGGGELKVPYKDTPCRPEASTVGSNYTISGKADFKFGEKMRKVVTHDFTIDRPLEIDLDSSNCNAVAFIACGLLGSILNPVLGVAAALACNKKVEEAKVDFQTKVREKSYEYVDKLNFSVAVD